MQSSWIEIGSVRPNERVGFRIYFHLVKQFDILQGAVELSLEHRAKINDLGAAIIK